MESARFTRAGAPLPALTVMTSQRANEIDLLRFLAALSVVLFHYAFRGYAADNLSAMPYPWLAPFAKYGYLGVQLFFMISGFVILMTATAGDLRTFLISRMTRLYPAFWACCTITFAAITAIGATRYSATPGQYLVNLTMLSGFLGIPSIDGVYWSLFVEIRFYAMVAFVLAIGQIRQAQPILVAWLMASLLLENMPEQNLLSYLLITDYSAFFIAGATLFGIWSEGPSPMRIAVVALCWVLAACKSLGAIADLQHHYNSVFDGEVVVGIISVFFVLMLLVALRRTGPLIRTHWLLAGALTYPLYLVHQYIGYMIFNLGYPRINAHLLFWGTVALAVGIAFSVHVLVERRFSRPLKNALNQLADALQPMARPDIRPAENRQLRCQLLSRSTEQALRAQR